MATTSHRPATRRSAREPDGPHVAYRAVLLTASLLVLGLLFAEI